MPGANGWLIRMAQGPLPHGIELAYFLVQTDTIETLATTPRLWRVLRPLRRTFDILPPKCPARTARVERTGQSGPTGRAPRGARRVRAAPSSVCAEAPNPRRSANAVRAAAAPRFSPAHAGRLIARSYHHNLGI
jgi:hypothetical protein